MKNVDRYFLDPVPFLGAYMYVCMTCYCPIISGPNVLVREKHLEFHSKNGHVLMIRTD